MDYVDLIGNCRQYVGEAEANNYWGDELMDNDTLWDYARYMAAYAQDNNLEAADGAYSNPATQEALEEAFEAEDRRKRNGS